MPSTVSIGTRCSILCTTEFRRFTLSVTQPSLLFFGPYTVYSEEGAQQGDPIGPLLFCNTIQPLLSSLQAELNVDYVDDVTLGGKVEMVASDVAEIPYFPDYKPRHFFKNFRVAAYIAV